MLFSEEIQRVFKSDTWTKVNKKLIGKMLSEYMYEDMIRPEILSENGEGIEYSLQVTDSKHYHYIAQKRLFDSFDVKWTTVYIVENGGRKEADSAIELLVDLQGVIGMSSETAGHLIKEMNSTLIADAHLLEKETKTSDELIHEDYATLEGYMTGHPWITYNKGRIGFGYDDYLAFAPEQQKEVQLSWIAVHKDLASFQSVEGLDYETLIAGELSEEDRIRFDKIVKQNGSEPSEYYFLPVHEWQWKNTLIQNFPEELAMGRIIPLGEGEDRYLPQQSIRTFVNRTNKDKHHVKLPMSILNTLVYRGLPSERTLIAPKVTEFIKGMAEKDPFLKDECRVILPGENASMNVNHRYYTQLKQAPYQYLEMLGTIWRESIYTYLEDGEQAITLAALLYEDHNNKPYVVSLIEQSGLDSEEWMKQFFKVAMDPLLHYLYQYGTVFSPHGQNTIVVLKDGKPHRLAIKDFVDDVNISDQDFPELQGLSTEFKAVLRTEPPEGLTQFIFTGLFICHLRYLSNLLMNNQMMEEETFWGLLADSILNYQKRFPQLQERFKLFDFFKPELTKLCLNRNRMVDYGYSDDDDRPHASEFGKVTNALAAFKINPTVGSI
ncbi:IucA/IucC family protein [Rossellomorea yichunensis]|jgi:siderophore synthetase component|uniref:IucA/IucC family protein n=1 Tax=Rossellomorea yichunensis TaxID=3077331 RepID=UPI0028DD5923|nr:IucA/IucC family siderophore biosynthesis protein [Rossellomorea sp. YC4-1]MDT9026303.1 IucA/IucC family siderophore biosynthesis protein [Rossellomorea sp. YC4-1]